VHSGPKGEQESRGRLGPISLHIGSGNDKTVGTDSSTHTTYAYNGSPVPPMGAVITSQPVAPVPGAQTSPAQSHHAASPKITNNYGPVINGTATFTDHARMGNDYHETMGASHAPTDNSPVANKQ
jgi:hypothetical protein